MDNVQTVLNFLSSSKDLTVEWVGARLATRSQTPHYPANLAAKARPVWDEIVNSDSFKSAVAGRPPETQYALAVRKLNELCKKRSIHPYTHGDAAGLPDASSKESLKRQINLCKSYVEQVFRNLLFLRLASSQENWKSLVVVKSNGLFRVQANKRIRIKRGSAVQVESLLRKNEHLGSGKLIHKVTPASRIAMSASGNYLNIVLGVVLSKAELIEALDLPLQSANITNEANRRIESVLSENMRSVVASSPSEDRILEATEVCRFVIRNVISHKMKFIKQKDKSFILVVKHEFVGNRPIQVKFIDSKSGDDLATSSFERRSRYDTPKVYITCDFDHYGIPSKFDHIDEGSSLFLAIRSGLESTVEVKKSYKSESIKTKNTGKAPPESFKESVAAMIKEWTRHGNIDDVTLPFPEFVQRFVMFFKTKNDAKIFDDATDNNKKILVSMLKSEWNKHQPQVASPSSNELRTLRVSSFKLLGTEDTIQLPSESVLRPIKKEDGDDTDIWQVMYPSKLFGTKLELSPDDYMNCSNIDSPIDSFSGSMDAAYEMVVENHNELPVFNTEDGNVGKLLGAAETWKFIESPAWLHHLNLKVSNKSLVFDKVKKDGKYYLAVIFHGDW